MAELTRIQLGQTFAEWRENLNTNFDALNEGKVEKETGKGLSTNDYTTVEKTKLANIADGAQVNVIETIKLNGTAKTVADKTVNITFEDLQAFMNKLSLALDSATGKIALSYNGTKLTNGEVDTALELIVVSGTYSSSEKNIILTLANGGTIKIPAQDLIDEYYADDTTIELTVVDGKETFKVADALMTIINTAVSDISNLKTRMTTAETNITNAQTAITALQNKVVTPTYLNFTATDSRWSSNSDGTYLLKLTLYGTTPNGKYYRRYAISVLKADPGHSVVCDYYYTYEGSSIQDGDGRNIPNFVIVADEKFEGLVIMM